MQMKHENLALMRLFRFASPGLPVGAFSYSQGIEWMVNQGYISDEEQLENWLVALMHTNQRQFELPVAAELYNAWAEGDLCKVREVNKFYYASRDCSELRDETIQMGRSMLDIFLETKELGDISQDFKEINPVTLPVVQTYALAGWRVGLRQCLTLILWTWLENQVVAAMKLIPIGHFSCQRLFFALEKKFEEIVKLALEMEKQQWSNFSPSQSIACAKHEGQYSRMFRS